MMVRTVSTRLLQQEGIWLAEASYCDGPGKKYIVTRYWPSSETEAGHGVKLGVPHFMKEKPSFSGGKIVPAQCAHRLDSCSFTWSGHFADSAGFDGQDLVFRMDWKWRPSQL